MTLSAAVAKRLLEGGGAAMTQLLAELRYKAEGRRFDSRWFHWIVSLT